MATSNDSARTRSAFALAIVSAVLFVAGAQVARAAAGGAGTDTAEISGPLRLVQVLEDGKDGVEGMYGARWSAVSPDGANIYVCSWWGDTLAVFARDAQSGQLTFLEAHRNGVNGVDGLGSPAATAVTPDGAHVYVASYGGKAVAVFARDPVSGQLTFVQAQREGLPGPQHQLVSLAVSPEGSHVYVSGEGTGNDVAVFARDATTGVLTPVEVVSTGLPPTYGLAVSPDGAHVYATGSAANAITAFQRDPTTGRLTRLASWREGVGGVQGLVGAFGVVLSRDGASVYVSAYFGNSMAAFARDANSGLLSFVQAVPSGPNGVEGISAPTGLVVSPDGAHLWVASRADKAIVLFSRDTNSGRLAFIEARRDVIPEWIGMGWALSPVLSPDGRYLYLTSLSYNALLVFSTDQGGMAPIVRCVGDCNWDSRVTIDKLITGVNIARNNAPLAACEMFDPDGSRTVSKDELVDGVDNALNGCVDALTPGDHHRTMVFGGTSRSYDVHIPPGYDGRTPVPLVLDFHGNPSNPTELAGLDGWRSLADTEGFIVAYPLGSFGQPEAPEIDSSGGPSFNAGYSCCGLAALLGIDDVGFARRIVQAIAEEANIDGARVYATGTSNGGFMSHRLACEAADTFAAVAPVAGRIALIPPTSCHPSRPIALIEFAGLHDPTVAYDGGFWPSAAQSLAYWRDRDGCGSGPPDERINLGTSYCEAYRNCSAEVQVEQCSVEASQVSAVPGHRLQLNPDLDVTRTAWEFLSQFRLPGA